MCVAATNAFAQAKIGHVSSEAVMKQLPDAQDAQKQLFGQNGDMFNKQNELMKPVQDRVFKAIQEVALEEGYDYVFDKSGEILLMYANPKYDLTPKVLQKLNINPTGSK
ncbi:MAG: OmpH family outer membrane protein [Ignavibacteriales bacterium]|nr:OmpH family outer membrane protein [Ignavibacteriales bacterium]